MKRISIVVITSLAFSLLTNTSSIAAVKAGGSCSKLGSTTTTSGYQYSCIKSGKKLIWNTGTKVKIETNTEVKIETNTEVKIETNTETFVPHSVEGNYGITWENVTSKFNDISAAAWTDAQATIIRNKGLESAFAGYKSYLSPGALATDPEIGEAEIYLKRAFSLFARIPAPKNVIFVATTQEERLATKSKIDRLYPDSNWIKLKLDDIYGINTDQPEGSVFTQTQCDGNDGARSVSTYPDGTKATALLISVCPEIGNSETHINGVHGMAHEYIHSIQVAVFVYGLFP